MFSEIDKSFGDLAALTNVSLAVKEGEIFSLLGPSGCGKTTLLRLAAGFLFPDRGRITLGGRDITSDPPEKRALNTIFQNYALFPHMSVRQNISFGPRTAGWPADRIRRETERLLALVQLETAADKKPQQLSGGQKQRVALARALILEPKVLLLDEPFAALDLKLRQRMLTELERLQREVGITFVFVTHDQFEAMSISDRIAVMRGGRIEQLGTPKAIYETPANRFVCSFIGDSNLLTGSRRGDGRAMDVAGLGVVVLPTQATRDEAVLAVRPEQVQLSLAAPVDGDNVFRGCILDRVYLGSHTRYTVDLGVLHLQAQLPAGSSLTALAVGDQAFVHWRAQDGTLLPDGDGGVP